jgi:transposase
MRSCTCGTHRARSDDELALCEQERSVGAALDRRLAVAMRDQEHSRGAVSRVPRLVCPYTLAHKGVRRAKLVLYAADGLSNVEIAARLDSNPEVVGRWRSRFARERMDGLQDRARSGRPRRFPPPQEVARVKAIACELPREAGVPPSRFSRAEPHRLVIERGVTGASASTIARWLAGRDQAVAAPLVDLPARSALA